MNITYKIASHHRYPSNNRKINNGGIGVEFIMNGSIFIFKKPITQMGFLNREFDVIDNDYLKPGYKRYINDLGMEVLDPRDCLFFKVLEYDESVPFVNGEKNPWKETGEIIYPKKSIIGTCEEHPEISDHSPETQIFRNTSYRKYAYDIYWNETKCGVDLSKYTDQIVYLNREHWIKDKHYPTKTKKDGTSYVDYSKTVFKARKVDRPRSQYKIDTSGRHVFMRSIELNKLLNDE